MWTSNAAFASQAFPLWPAVSKDSLHADAGWISFSKRQLQWTHGRKEATDYILSVCIGIQVTQIANDTSI